jgi:SAM-dependent methyltransferase
MRVLEVGCGAGGYTEMMGAALRGRGEWVGVDHDDALLDQARRDRKLDVPLRFERADALALPFPDASFDTVVSAFLLCVLPSPLAALREMTRVVRPGGVVSSISCFCKSGGLPLFHGIEAWDGMERYAELEPRVRSAFRRLVRNPGLGVPSGKDLDVWGDYAKVGLVDLRISGYLPVYAPSDARWSEEDAQDWLARRESVEENLFERLAGDHARLEKAGVTKQEVDELLVLTKRRFEHLRQPGVAKRNMDAFADPNVVITGRRPCQASVDSVSSVVRVRRPLDIEPQSAQSSQRIIKLGRARVVASCPTRPSTPSSPRSGRSPRRTRSAARRTCRTRASTRARRPTRRRSGRPSRASSSGRAGGTACSNGRVPTRSGSPAGSST